MMKHLALAAMLLLPATAQAHRTSVAMQFAAVLQESGHRQLVLYTAKQTPVWTRISCRAARFARAPEIGVYVRVQFDKSGIPISGEWREGVVASGCGAPITLNVLTLITAPATLATGYLLPGDTIADPILQNYAQSFALKAAGGLPNGCTDAYVANTKFVGYDGPGSAGNIGPWKEVWTLHLCGPPRRVLMQFIPDATGTTIAAHPE